MKRLISITALVLILMFSMCMTSYGADIVMKAAHGVALTHPRHEAWLIFKELVEHRSDGKIEVELYPANQLGTQKEILESVKMGNIQACTGGHFEGASEKLLIYTMPFLFKDVESTYDVIRGPVAEEINESTEKNGIKILATGIASGLRNFTNNKRPIETPEDMKGLKMRTPPIDSIVKTMEALEANPVSIPYADLYMGLKTGVADGQENPFVNMVTKNVYEVQKYLTVVNYQYHPNPIYANLEWYESLSSENQKLIKTAAEDMMIFCDYLNRRATEESFQLLEEEMEVNELTDEQHQQFVEKTESVYDYYIDEGYFTWDEVEMIREAAE